MENGIGGVEYLDAEERSLLLSVARRAVESYVRKGDVPPEELPPGPLGEKGAAFVTLTKGGRLRGCIGYTEPFHPLWRTVQECAVAAATEDPRFPKVKAGELESIRMEVSVLTPLVPIRPGEVVVGLHGLVVERGGWKGLLLPQVASEYGWDAETFLAQTCRKAGLPADAWKEAGTKIYGFTAQVFGEEGEGATS